MRLPLIIAIFLLACGVVKAQNSDNKARYITGGHVPLSNVLQREMDARANQIRLGFNTQFLTDAGVSPEAMAKIVIEVCDLLPKHKLPGMIIYIDSFDQQNIPIALGNRVQIPNQAPMEWSTYFDVGSLTAPLITMPFLLSALEAEPNFINENVSSKQFTEKLGNITHKDLLHHQMLWADRDEALHSKGLYYADSVVPKFEFSEGESMNCWSSVQDVELLAESLANQFESPLKPLFMDQVALPLGMMNSVMDSVPDTWRSDVAPGGLTAFHDRYAWGEAYSPSAFLLQEQSVRGGFFSTADDLGIYARYWMKAYNMGSGDAFTSETFQQTLQPQALREGIVYGTGWQLGDFGEKSFGWTGPDGRAFWVDPESNVFCIILSNPEHLQQYPQDLSAFTRSLVARLHHALLQHKTIAFTPVKKKPLATASSLDSCTKIEL